MSRPQLLKEDLELDNVREQELLLLKRERETEESRRRIAEERMERESTMPPLDEIAMRRRLRQHDICVSRGEVANVRRDQNRSFMMLVLLVATTCSLIWWGLRLMQGT